jgi:hypothetical protein
MDERRRSKIPEWVTSGIENILFHIHPESEEYIDDDRGPHRQTGDIHEIFPDGSG